MREREEPGTTLRFGLKESEKWRGHPLSWERLKQVWGEDQAFRFSVRCERKPLAKGSPN